MIKVQINGSPKQFDGDPEMPLLWYLRDELELTGTKFGCGGGFCGACTVHLNGTAVRSCQTSMKDAAAKSVTTIEGLSATAGASSHADGVRYASHPLQMSWETVNVPQCGYCQSGQIMQAASMLKKYPKPTDAQIDDEMSGNICRCGTYQRIRAAIKIAAAASSHASGVRSAGVKA